MHAIRIHAFGNADVLALDDVPVPELRDHEFVVHVMAASVNPVDYKIRSGKYPPVDEKQLPKVLGRDISGIVEGVGSSIQKFRPGDAIYAMLGPDSGGYAEYAQVTEAQTAKKPDSLDFIQAAAVPLAALTAWQGLFEHGRLKAGQRVLIHGGSGGVGHFAVQFAKAKGAWVATTVSGADLDLALALGADQAIDYQKEKFENAVSEIDLVFDLVAGQTQARSWAVLKDGGSLISTLQNPDQDEAKRRGIHATNYMAKPSGAQLEEIGRLIDQGKVNVVIDSTFPLDAAAQAQKHIEEEHVRGKVVLRVVA